MRFLSKLKSVDFYKKLPRCACNKGVALFDVLASGID